MKQNSQLRQADNGPMGQVVCRDHNISVDTFYRWKKKHGRMDLAAALRLKDLKKEYAEFKTMLTVNRDSDVDRFT